MYVFYNLKTFFNKRQNYFNNLHCKIFEEIARALEMKVPLWRPANLKTNSQNPEKDVSWQTVSVPGTCRS